MRGQFTLPPNGIPTTLVRATQDRPAVCHRCSCSPVSAKPGRDFTLVDFDCDHMVAQAQPAETAAVIREQLEHA